MSKVVREENNDNLTAVLTVQIEKADYMPQFKAELQKRAKNTKLKGFRQGKTSLSTLVKLFGKKTLPIVIDDILKDKLDNHIQENELKLFGSLLPNEEHKQPEYNHKNLQDFEFKFDIAYFPDFKLKGVDKDSTYERYELELTDDDIAENIENLKKSGAVNVEITEDIQENDMLRLKVQELEGADIKADGATGEFPVLVKTIVDEAIKAEILTKKQGDTIRLNIFKLEKETENHTSFVRKNYLSLPDDDPTVVGEEYEAVISEVKRLQDPEMDQAFFDKTFGPGRVTNEEEMKTFIKDATVKAYVSQIDDLLFNDIQTRMIELTTFDLPADFLMRWFKYQKRGEETKITPDALVKGTHWNLLRSRFIEKFELKVTKEDIEAAANKMLMQYMGYADPKMLEELLKNKETVNKLQEDAINSKIVAAGVGAVTIEKKPISLKDYHKMLEENQAKNQAESKALSGEETESAETVEAVTEEE